MYRKSEVMSKVELKPKDSKEEILSLDPSYTNLRKLPYYILCRRRVRRTIQNRQKQMEKEIKLIGELPIRALDYVRSHRIGTSPFLRLPKESEIIKLSETEQRRLDEIMKSP